MSATTPTRPGRCRRASVYVAVLGVAAMVTVIGLSALTAVRIQRRAAESGNDLAAARLYAQAAIELGLCRIAQDPDWRTTYTSGTWVSDQPIGDGTFSLSGDDPDDKDLSNSASDPVVLTGTGVKGEARARLQVTLTAEGQGLTCLEVALHAGADLAFDAALVQCDQTISANNSVTAANSEIYASVEAVNTISGGAYGGPQTIGITPRTVPDSTVFDSYIAGGTAIGIAAIPSSAGKPTIQDVVLSPAGNPYGPTTNPAGIYVIDCLGQTLIIQNCRIFGTLVLLNPSSSSAVQLSVNWEPASANYPALLVKGGLGFAFTTTALSESARGVNFNPAGAPSASGEDTDLVDTYPSVIKGLVYVSTDMQTSSDCTFDGVVVVGNTLTATNRLTLTYQASILNNPPPGFGDAPAMSISAGSWRPVVD